MCDEEVNGSEKAMRPKKGGERELFLSISSILSSIKCSDREMKDKLSLLSLRCYKISIVLNLCLGQGRADY